MEALSRRRGVKDGSDERKRGCDWSSSRASDNGWAKSRALGVDSVAISLSRSSVSTCARSRSWYRSVRAWPMRWAVPPGTTTDCDSGALPLVGEADDRLVASCALRRIDSIVSSSSWTAKYSALVAVFPRVLLPLPPVELRGLDAPSC